jgi:ADP-heptose:LPS heptosyltransferase
LEGQRRFLNEGVFLPSGLRKAHPTHKLEKYAALNQWPMPEPIWRLQLDQAALAKAHSWLGPESNPQTGRAGSSSRCLLMGIGAMSEARRWPLRHFSELLCLLARYRPDLQIIVTGGPEDKAAAQEIVSSLDSGQKPRLLFDSLAVAIACQSLVDGYVGNDTSLLNIAAALDKPALGFFSQSPPMVWSEQFYHSGQIAEDEFGQPGIITKITPAGVLKRMDEIWPRAGWPDTDQT